MKKISIVLSVLLMALVSFSASALRYDPQVNVTFDAVDHVAITSSMKGESRLPYLSTAKFVAVKGDYKITLSNLVTLDIAATNITDSLGNVVPHSQTNISGVTTMNVSFETGTYYITQTGFLRGRVTPASVNIRKGSYKFLIDSIIVPAPAVGDLCEGSSTIAAHDRSRIWLANGLALTYTGITTWVNPAAYATWTAGAPIDYSGVYLFVSTAPGGITICDPDTVTIW